MVMHGKSSKCFFFVKRHRKDFVGQKVIEGASIGSQVGAPLVASLMIGGAVGILALAAFACSGGDDEERVPNFGASIFGRKMIEVDVVHVEEQGSRFLVSRFGAQSAKQML